MFRFAYPEYLWLLWLLPLLVAVWTAAGQLARRRLSRFGRLETIRPLMPTNTRFSGLFILGCSFN